MVRFPPVPFDPAEKAPAIDAFTGDRPAAWARSRTAPTLLLPSDPARSLTADRVAELHAWQAAW